MMNIFRKILIFNFILIITSCSAEATPSKSLPVDLHFFLDDPKLEGNCRQKLSDYEKVLKNQLQKFGWQFGKSILIEPRVGNATPILKYKKNENKLITGQVAIQIDFNIIDAMYAGVRTCVVNMDVQPLYYDGSGNILMQKINLSQVYPDQHWERWDKDKYYELRKFLQEILK